MKLLANNIEAIKKARKAINYKECINAFNRVSCVVKGHKRSNIGAYYSDCGRFVYRYKCDRCGCSLGLPSYSKEYLEKTFPMPKGIDKLRTRADMPTYTSAFSVSDGRDGVNTSKTAQ